MASTWSNLGLNLQGTGDNSGTWGQLTNVNLQDIDNAISGVYTLTVTGSTTLAFTTNSSATTYTDEVGRNKIIILNGSLSATTITITTPNIEKDYIIINNSGATATISAGGSTTVSIATATKAYIYVDGASAVNFALPQAVSGLSIGGTTNAIQYNNAGALAGSTNLTFNGTTLAMQTATALNLTATTLSYTTATGVNLTITNFTATNATTTGLAFTTATGGTATLTTAAITTANVTTANITSLTAVTATATTLNSTTVNITGNGTLKIYNTANTQYTGLQVLAAAATTVTFTLPSSDGTSNQALVTNGSGTLSFSSISGGFSGATTYAIGTTSVTLTSSSSQYQKVQINSTTNSYVTLPNATTLATKGYPVFVIENASPINNSLDIKNNGGTILATLAVNAIGQFALVDNTTTNGTWAYYPGGAYTNAIDFNQTLNTNTATGNTSMKVIHLTATKLLVANFYMNSSNLTVYTKIGDLSGSTITFGSEQSTNFSSGSALYNINDYRADVIRLSDSSFILMVGRKGVDSSPFYRSSKSLCVNTVSGTVVTFGTQNSLSFPSESAGTASDGYYQTANEYNGLCCRMDDNKFAVVYNTATTNTATSVQTSFSGSLTAQIITTSGTTLTVGTKVDLATSTFTNPATLVCHDTDKLCVVYYQATSATNGTGRNKVNIISVSTRTPTWGTSVNVESADITDVGSNVLTSPVSTGLNNIFGVALSTTSVIGFGGGGTGLLLISISSTTPSIIAKNQVNIANSVILPINSTTCYIAGTTYLYINSGVGFRTQGTTNTATSIYSSYVSYYTLRSTSASTSFTAYNQANPYNASSPNYFVTGTLMPWT